MSQYLKSILLYNVHDCLGSNERSSLRLKQRREGTHLAKVNKTYPRIGNY